MPSSNHCWLNLWRTMVARWQVVVNVDGSKRLLKCRWLVIPPLSTVPSHRWPFLSTIDHATKNHHVTPGYESRRRNVTRGIGHQTNPGWVGIGNWQCMPGIACRLYINYIYVEFVILSWLGWNNMGVKHGPGPKWFCVSGLGVPMYLLRVFSFQQVAGSGVASKIELAMVNDRFPIRQK